MQKYHKYDLVRIAKDLGSSMSHFPNNKRAIIIGSSADEFGDDDTDSYTVFIEGHGECSWYHEWQLELISANRKDIYNIWKSKMDRKAREESDLDWIFKNGKKIMNDILEKNEYPSGKIVITLAKALGISENDMWGSHGEGVTFMQSYLQVLEMAVPFLLKEDKDLWISIADKAKKKI